MNEIEQLIEAIKNTDIDKTNSLLLENPELANKNTPNGISILQLAAYYRNNEAVELIKHHKVKLNIYEQVILGNSGEVAKYFMQNNTTINSYSSDGFTPLGLACFFSHFTTAQKLISLGANVNTPSKNSFKVTPLHSACASSNIKIAELLLKNNANVNARQQNGVTPLHSAAHKGNLALVQLLVANGANVSAKMESGQTPLMMAEEQTFTGIADFLKLNTPA